MAMGTGRLVRGIGRDLFLIKCGYVLGTRDARDLRAPPKLLPTWPVGVRTAYVYAKLLGAPNFVTCEEMDMADWQLLSSLLGLSAEEADAWSPQPPKMRPEA
jgi:hypothetical protein